MSPIVLFSFVIGYFVLLLTVAYFTSRGSKNESFFIGNRNSNWMLVAFGMIGTSLSGVTFVSVPGSVGTGNFYYYQIVLGYLIGYMVIAFVLIPLYYKMNLTSIYTYLERRFGILITCFENRGDFIEGVKSHVKDFSVDLIVLGTKKRSWLKEIFIENKVNSVIGALNCEVLCVSSGSQTSTLKKIVVPVSKAIPKKKIGIAYEFAKKFAGRIYLIALNGSEKKLSDQGTKTLIASYRYLKDLTNIPIECSTVNGTSLASATMHYAQIVGADLILINEGSESYFKKPLWNGNIVNHSAVPVLSVHSMNNKERDKYPEMKAVR